MLPSRDIELHMLFAPVGRVGPEKTPDSAVVITVSVMFQPVPGVRLCEVTISVSCSRGDLCPLDLCVGFHLYILSHWGFKGSI